jgi:hypothetical protein
MPLFDISLDTANKLYAWGWRGSLLGAVVTLVAVSLLMWGTRVRDRDSETQLANLNHEAADSRERAATLESRAAELEKEAAEARLEQEKLKAQLAWRRLSDDQARTITAHLTGLAFKPTLSAITSDPESTLFALDIHRAMTAAGIAVQIQSKLIFGSHPIVGLIISGPRADVERVAEGFVKAGISVTGQEREGTVEILVGSKPPPAQ